MTNSSGHRADIQGLRAIAVLLVLLFHFETPIQGGFLGVDMFFVISGFVIASSTLREIDRSQAFNWKAFIRRRVRRLLPGVAVVSLITACISLLLLSPFGPQQTTAEMLIGASSYVSNFILMPRNYFSLDPKANPLMHFWSLAVEEQFYFVWPIFITALLALRARVNRLLFRVLMWTFIGMVTYWSCRLFIWLSVDGPTINNYSWFRPLIEQGISPERLAFYSPLTRAWEFVAGVLVAVLLRSQRKQLQHYVGSFVSIGGAVLVFIGVRWATITPGIEHGTETATNTSATLAAVIGTALLVYGGSTDRLMTRTLAIKPLVRIGDWSYSVYLWHWPIWVILITMYSNNYTTGAIAFVLSMAFGWAQYNFIENPIREGRKLITCKIPTLTLGFFALTCVMFVMMSAATSAIGERVAGREPSEISLHIVEQECTVEVFTLDSARSCPYLVPESRGSVVLVGDSLARSLSDGLVVAANAEQLDAYVFIYPGCAFLIFDSPFSPTRECIEWRQHVFAAINQIKPKAVMITNLNSLYTSAPLADFSLDKTGDAWGYELGRTLESFAPLQTPIVLVQPPPAFEFDLRYDISLVRPNGKSEQRNVVIARRARINEIEVETASKYSFVQPVVNFTDLFCNAESCVQKIGKQFMLEDPDHLSVEGSLLTTPLLQSAIAAAVPR